MDTDLPGLFIDLHAVHHHRKTLGTCTSRELRHPDKIYTRPLTRRSLSDGSISRYPSCSLRPVRWSCGKRRASGYSPTSCKTYSPSERKTLYLLLACSVVCVRFYFARGGMHWAADALSPHRPVLSRRQSHRRRRVAYMDIPHGQWIALHAKLRLCLLFISSAWSIFFRRDIFLSLKLVMGTTHVLSGIGMYYLASSLCQSRRAGFIAGLGYVLCFWQHATMYSSWDDYPYLCSTLSCPGPSMLSNALSDHHTKYERPPGRIEHRPAKFHAPGLRDLYNGILGMLLSSCGSGPYGAIPT